MTFDEAAHRVGEDHHDDHRQDHGDDHDGNLIDHADSGDHGIKRKHDVEQTNLYEHSEQRRHGTHFPMFVLSLNVVVNFVRALHEKKQSAGHQNYGAAGDFETRNSKERMRESCDPSDENN